MGMCRWTHLSLKWIEEIKWHMSMAYGWVPTMINNDSYYLLDQRAVVIDENNGEFEQLEFTTNVNAQIIDDDFSLRSFQHIPLGKDSRPFRCDVIGIGVDIGKPDTIVTDI